MAYRHILLIDDDYDDQEIFLSAVHELTVSADCPVDCIALGDAENALHQLKNGQVPADLIFLDLNMPMMDGRQFLAELKSSESLREIPVIILSTSSNRETIQETRKLGAFDFLTKPTSFTGLKSILKSIIC
jgi:CheY-like chemotaxis protein